MPERTSTLASTEQRFATLTLALFAICVVVGIALFSAHVEVSLFVLWLALTASNALYIAQHTHPTVGMAPVSVASLAPASASALLAPHLPGPLLWLSFLVLLGSLAVICVFGFWFVRLRGAWSHRNAIGDKALVIVLGGTVVDGKPRPTLACRLDTAVQVCDEHTSAVLVLSGGPLANEAGCEAEAMERYVVAAGIPRERIIVEPRARNTRENILFSLELAGKRGLFDQRCVLTSDYHLYRAIQEGRRLGLELTPIPAPTPLNSRLQQWCREVLTILAKA